MSKPPSPSLPPAGGTRLRTLAVALGLVAATFAAYAGVRANGFVLIDDEVYVTANPWVRAGLTRVGLVWAFTERAAGNWHPLTWLSHMTDVELFGLAPAAHHLVNVGLHALGAVLLFLALRTMSGALWTSAAVAGLFALHPLRVESVAWVAERKDVLAGVFWMLTLLAHAHYARRPSATRYGLVAAALAAGLMAKAMLVTLPFVLLLVDLWPLRRFGSDGTTEDGPFPPRPLARLVLEKLPLLALCAVSAGLTYASQLEFGAIDVHGAIPWDARLANALQAVLAYVQSTLWPAGLAVFYPHRALVWPERAAFGGAALTGLALVIALLSLAWHTRRRRPWVTVGILWMLGTLVPVIGLVQVGVQARADRYTYLPMIGLYLVLAWSVRAAVAGRPGARRAATGVTLAALALCLALTRTQVRHWRDGVTLFERALAVTEQNYFAHNHLALVLERRGEIDRAIAELQDAVRVLPRYSDGHNNLGLVLLHAGRPEEAELSLRRALAIEPRQPEALSNLGIVLVELGREEEALASFRRVTRIAPDHLDGWINLGTLALRLGTADEATAAFQQALLSAPTDARVHAAIGTALSADQEWRPALTALRRAYELDPSDLKSANQAAWILASCPDPALRDGREALRLARRCVKATSGRRVAFLETQAAAHAELGDFEAAVRVQTQALELAVEDRRGTIRARLVRYRAGRSLADG